MSLMPIVIRRGIRLFPGQNNDRLCPTTDFDETLSGWTVKEPSESECFGRTESKRRLKPFINPINDALCAEIVRVKAPFMLRISL